MAVIINLKVIKKINQVIEKCNGLYRQKISDPRTSAGIAKSGNDTESYDAQNISHNEFIELTKGLVASSEDQDLLEEADAALSVRKLAFVENFMKLGKDIKAASKNLFESNDEIADRERGLAGAQRARVEQVAILKASGKLERIKVAAQEGKVRVDIGNIPRTITNASVALTCMASFLDKVAEKVESRVIKVPTKSREIKWTVPARGSYEWVGGSDEFTSRHSAAYSESRREWVGDPSYAASATVRKPQGEVTKDSSACLKKMSAQYSKLSEELLALSKEVAEVARKNGGVTR